MEHIYPAPWNSSMTQAPHNLSKSTHRYPPRTCPLSQHIHKALLHLVVWNSKFSNFSLTRDSGWVLRKLVLDDPLFHVEHLPSHSRQINYLALSLCYTKQNTSYLTGCSMRNTCKPNPFSESKLYTIPILQRAHWAPCKLLHAEHPHKVIADKKRGALIIQGSNYSFEQVHTYRVFHMKQLLFALTARDKSVPL